MSFNDIIGDRVIKKHIDPTLDSASIDNGHVATDIKPSFTPVNVMLEDVSSAAADAIVFTNTVLANIEQNNQSNAVFNELVDAIKTNTLTPVEMEAGLQQNLPYAKITYLNRYVYENMLDPQASAYWDLSRVLSELNSIQHVLKTYWPKAVDTANEKNHVRRALALEQQEIAFLKWYASVVDELVRFEPAADTLQALGEIFSEDNYHKQLLVFSKLLQNTVYTNLQAFESLNGYIEKTNGNSNLYLSNKIQSVIPYIVYAKIDDKLYNILERIQTTGDATNNSELLELQNQAGFTLKDHIRDVESDMVKRESKEVEHARDLFIRNIIKNNMNQVYRVLLNQINNTDSFDFDKASGLIQLIVKLRDSSVMPQSVDTTFYLNTV